MQTKCMMNISFKNSQSAEAGDSERTEANSNSGGGISNQGGSNSDPRPNSTIGLHTGSGVIQYLMHK